MRQPKFPYGKTVLRTISPILSLIMISGCSVQSNIQQRYPGKVAAISPQGAAKIVETCLNGTGRAQGLCDMREGYSAKVEPNTVYLSKCILSETKYKGASASDSWTVTNTGDFAKQPGDESVPSGKYQVTQGRTLYDNKRYSLPSTKRIVVTRVAGNPMYFPLGAKGDYFVSLQAASLLSMNWDLYVDFLIAKDQLPTFLLAMARLAPHADVCSRSQGTLDTIYQSIEK